MPRGSSGGKSGRPSTTGQEKPKTVTNRIVNKHPRLPQYAKSMGPGDVARVERVNISTPLSNQLRGEGDAGKKPTIVTGSITTSTNKYRSNTD